MGSLRQASIDAASGDTIRFNPNLLTGAVDSISLVTEINFGIKGIVIKGLYTSTDTLFISGANSSRIFSFNGAGKVVLDSLILINGNVTTGMFPFSYEGGAISSIDCSDTLHIFNSIISGNVASTGGGVYSYSNTGSSIVEIVNSSFLENTASSSGGGVYSFSNTANSTVKVTNSTFTENTAIDGGAIYCLSNTAVSSVSIGYSIINSNTANNDGGGIFSLSGTSTSDVTITSSTFTGNIAGLKGGGISSKSNNSISTVTISNSTIYNNTSTDGKGIYSDCLNPSFSSITIGSSIIAENGISSSGISNTNTTTIISNGYNIFSDAPTGATGTGDVTGSTTINLQPLAFNGGSTQTMLPGTGSSAIDVGDINDMSDAQNRNITGGIRDIGAAETTCIATAGAHNETVCFGDSIVVNGEVYNANNLTGTEVFTNVGINNCDSTVTVTLTVLPELTGTHNETICFGDSIVINGTTYNANNLAGSEVFTVGANSCDSTVAVTLTIENAIDASTTTSGLTITANATGATYNWIDCNTSNSIVPAETGVSYTATVNGDYAVVVTVGNCSDTSDCINVNTVGINNHQNLINNITIYPNPAVNKLTIENGDLKINTISIINITGEIVEKGSINTNTIDVSNLTKGIYFLQIHTDNGLVSKKFVKE